MLAGWRGELEVDLELFAADVELALEACQQRGKLSFEQYVAWFAQSGFQTMPRYKGRFRRLFKALEKLRKYTRMVYREIPDPRPASPTPVVHTVLEEQSAPAQLVHGSISATGALDVDADAAFSAVPRPEEASTSEAVATAESALEGELDELERYYLADLEGWPAGEFSFTDLTRIDEARRHICRHSELLRRHQPALAARAAARAVDTMRSIYGQASPAGRLALAINYAACIVDHAVAVEGDVNQRDFHASLWQESISILREALARDPYNVDFLKELAVSFIEAPDHLRTEAVTSEAADIFRKLLRVCDARGGEVATYLRPSFLRKYLIEALLLFGAARYPAQPAEAVDAWEEGDRHLRLQQQATATLSALDIEDALLHSTKISLSLANAHADKGEDKRALARTRDGLKSCQLFESATNDREVARTRKGLLGICRKLLPREEKRLVKLVNIRKIQAKTRKQGRQVATEEQKGEVAAAVAELADLRELQRALKEGSL